MLPLDRNVVFYRGVQLTASPACPNTDLCVWGKLCSQGCPAGELSLLLKCEGSVKQGRFSFPEHLVVLASKLPVLIRSVV